MNTISSSSTAYNRSKHIEGATKGINHWNRDIISSLSKSLLPLFQSRRKAMASTLINTTTIYHQSTKSNVTKDVAVSKRIDRETKHQQQPQQQQQQAKKEKVLGQELTDGALMIVQFIAESYLRIMEENDEEDIEFENIQMTESDKFTGKSAPKIPLLEYIIRLVSITNWFYEDRTKAGGAESAGMVALIVSTIYLERALESDTHLYLNSRNVHRLVLTSMIAAIKFTQDISPKVNDFAFMGGITKEQVAELEWAFGEVLGFRFWVDKELIDRCYKNISNRINSTGKIQTV